MEPRKVNEIKRKLRIAAEGFFSSIQDVEIRELFEKYAFIAGGAIASLILDEKPNDYDFYFKNPEACYRVVKYFINQMPDAGSECRDIQQKVDGVSVFVSHGIHKVEKTGQKYQPVAVTSNAFSFTDEVQFVMRFVASPDEIKKNFDFEHSKGIYDYGEDKLIVSEETEKAIVNKRLIFTGSEYPLASLIRTRKFISRGWKINAGQYLKIALQLNQLDLSDPMVLREQLVGVDLFHFADFLEKLQTVGMDNIDFEQNNDHLFNMIDEAFQRSKDEEDQEEE
ncbi:hypothetical protein ACFVS2_20100 [Brevibacillus sp. NPDC058079]|uniref:hypothetical protein n=1 Tax=Brevibacillus sp. NPDC058079 TaxID=3346330 RepID=UPI0036E10CDE